MELGLWAWTDLGKEGPCLRLCAVAWLLQNVLTSPQVPETDQYYLGKMPWGWIKNHVDPGPISSLPNALQLCSALVSTRSWEASELTLLGNKRMGSRTVTWQGVIPADLEQYFFHGIWEWAIGWLTPSLLTGQVPGLGLLWVTDDTWPWATCTSPCIITCLSVSTVVSLNYLQHLRMAGQWSFTPCAPSLALRVVSPPLSLSASCIQLPFGGSRDCAHWPCHHCPCLTLIDVVILFSPRSVLIHAR